MATEFLTCRSCWSEFSRVVKRGRKPELCYRCRPVAKPPQVRPGVGIQRLVITNGGRDEIGGFETNDCTVRAIALATGAGYKAAHTFLAANGRRRGKGCYFEQIVHRNGNTILGCKLEHIYLVKSRGLNMALTRNPQLRRGVWILQMKGHVATLKSGKLMDSFDSSRKEIRGAYRVSPVV